LGLYQGRSATELAAVAPYLVCLGISDRVFDWLWDEGWGESWGVFLWSLVSTDTLRAHFRRLTMVRTDAGERLLFRFYDPRVLGEFLPTCEAAQLREMFGPVQRFMLERDGGREIASFRALEQVGAGQPAGGIGAARDQVSTSLTGGAGARGILQLVQDTVRLDSADVAQGELARG